MLNNYHTHTWRCNHASGTEREYVEAAISRGMKTLGFSDHAPYFFTGEYYSGYRMRREELRGYVDTLQALKKEYAGRIEIKIGLEMEYYPQYFDQIMDFLQPFELDYLILGQHFLGNEIGEMPSSHKTGDSSVLIRYVDQVLEGLKTGVYTYLAHPDLLNFSGDDAVWQREMNRLCEEMKKADIPVEMNLLGFAEKRAYPRKDFFEIVKCVGNTVVLGCDAHTLQQMQDVQIEQEARLWLQDFNIEPVQNVQLRKPLYKR